MKKSDTLAVLAGLVITGVGWRFGGPQWGIPLAVAAAISFLLVHTFWKEKTPLSTSPSQTITDSFKQTIENVGNPIQNANPIAKIEQHFHISPSEPRVATASIPTPLRNPNVVFCGVREIVAHMNEAGEEPLGVFEYSGGELKALVASFRNGALAGRDVEPLYGIRAQVIYRDKQDSEITSLSGLHWLGEASDTVDLVPSGQIHSLVVLVIGNKLLFAPWKKHTRGNWMGSGLDNVSFHFKQLPSTALARLLRENGSLIYEVEIAINWDILGA